MRGTSHVGKTRVARDYYSKQIKNLEAEPTVDETIKFAESDDTQRDFSQQTSRRRRPTPISQQLGDHFKSHWLEWVLGIILSLLVFLSTDSRISMARLEETVKTTRDDVRDLKDADRETKNKLQQQQLDLQRNQIRMDNLEKVQEGKGRR